MLKALLLSDGKPGHYHLAEGVLAAVERLRPTTIETVRVRRPRWLTPGLLWRLSSSGFSPAVILGYAYGIDASELPKANLVVSAGGDTLAANIAASHVLGAPNVFYGSLRRYAPEHFSLVLTSYARNADKPRHAMSLKPSKLDPDKLAPLDARVAGEPPKVAGLLIGGDAGTVHYADADWDRLLAFVTDTATEHGTRWIVSNSPRTPPSVSTRLRRAASGDESPISDFIDVTSAGTGTLTDLFSRSDVVVCTADSSSMVSEAVWARRPVVAVAPESMSLPADEQDYRHYLEQNGWAKSVPIAELTPANLLAVLARLKPISENPLDSLGRVLSDRLPDVFATR